MARPKRLSAPFPASRQHRLSLMHAGTAEQVAEHTRKLIDVAGKDGGFILDVAQWRTSARTRTADHGQHGKEYGSTRHAERVILACEMIEDEVRCAGVAPACRQAAACMDRNGLHDRPESAELAGRYRCWTKARREASGRRAFGAPGRGPADAPVRTSRRSWRRWSSPGSAATPQGSSAENLTLVFPRGRLRSLLLNMVRP